YRYRHQGGASYSTLVAGSEISLESCSDCLL
ncbi:hypothetical protein LINGRAHAP2_LOCUS29519, partial [Linum grandiflorum]